MARSEPIQAIIKAHRKALEKEFEALAKNGPRKLFGKSVISM